MTVRYCDCCKEAMPKVLPILKFVEDQGSDGKPHITLWDVCMGCVSKLQELLGNGRRSELSLEHSIQHGGVSLKATPDSKVNQALKQSSRGADADMRIGPPYTSEVK